jgi:hypothetical protein
MITSEYQAQVWEVELSSAFAVYSRVAHRSKKVNFIEKEILMMLT